MIYPQRYILCKCIENKLEGGKTPRRGGAGGHVNTLSFSAVSIF